MRAECYIEGGQEDTPAGTEGGPLRVTVETAAWPYIFVRGFCRKGNPVCTPH